MLGVSASFKEMSLGNVSVCHIFHSPSSTLAKHVPVTTARLLSCGCWPCILGKKKTCFHQRSHASNSICPLLALVFRAVVGGIKTLSFNVFNTHDAISGMASSHPKWLTTKERSHVWWPVFLDSHMHHQFTSPKLSLDSCSLGFKPKNMHIKLDHQNSWISN